jgi:hypothetical protein
MSALMYVCSTLHALPASVCVASSPRAVFISLQVESQLASRVVAAVFSWPSAVLHARIVACALDAVALRPLHPAAACCALCAALHPFPRAAITGSATTIIRTRPKLL